MLQQLPTCQPEVCTKHNGHKPTTKHVDQPLKRLHTTTCLHTYPSQLVHKTNFQTEGHLQHSATLNPFYLSPPQVCQPPFGQVCTQCVQPYSLVYNQCQFLVGGVPDPAGPQITPAQPCGPNCVNCPENDEPFCQQCEIGFWNDNGYCKECTVEGC